MKQLLALAAVILLSASVSATSTTQSGVSNVPPQAAPAGAVKTIAGKWNVTVDVNGNPLVSVLDIKLDGKKITGTLTNDQSGVSPVEGEFADAKLTLRFNYTTQNGPVPVVFTATLKDEIFTGTADAGQMGQFPFKAERSKEK